MGMSVTVGVPEVVDIHVPGYTLNTGCARNGVCAWMYCTRVSGQILSSGCTRGDVCTRSFGFTRASMCFRGDGCKHLGGVVGSYLG